MYKSFDKLVCTGTITITYIQRPNTRYVKIHKNEFTVMILAFALDDWEFYRDAGLCSAMDHSNHFLLSSRLDF